MYFNGSKGKFNITSIFFNSTSSPTEQLTTLLLSLSLYNTKSSFIRLLFPITFLVHFFFSNGVNEIQLLIFKLKAYHNNRINALSHWNVLM